MARSAVWPCWLGNSHFSARAATSRTVGRAGPRIVLCRGSLQQSVRLPRPKLSPDAGYRADEAKLAQRRTRPPCPPPAAQPAHATHRVLADVTDVKFVINFDYPNNSEDYIHRIGRTARSYHTGTAYTFFTPENAGKARDLIAVLREAKQVVNPKLVELQGRGGFGGRSRYGGGRGFGGGGGGRRSGFGGGRY